jgi:Protein of unknown function (DUF1631)
MTMFPMPRIGLADNSAGSKPALHDCIEAVLMQSDSLMDGVITGLNAPKTRGNSKAAHISDNADNRAAAEHLRVQAREVRETFAAELRSALYNRGTHDMAVRPSLRFDDFQFLDEIEIDANIEFALTQQELSQSVDDVLPPLNALISNLLGLVTVQSQLNPIKPDAFVQALRACFTKHVRDDTVRIALLTAAARLLGISLRQLYKDLAQWLRSQGIESALPAGTLMGGSGVSGAKMPETAVSRTLLTLDKLRRLLSGDFDGGFGSAAAVPKDFLHTVPYSVVALEDLKLVEPMMLRLAKRAKQQTAVEVPSDANFGNSGMLANDNPQSRQIGRQLGGEVVRLMLENLTNDKRLLPRVRELLKELEPVLLQLSQSDPRYFSERLHPARQLLDRMTHRSLAFSSESDEGFGKFSKEIANTVQALASGGGDAASFARGLRKLEEGWERDDLAQRKRHEESAKSLLQAEQRNMLAQRFAEDFQKRVKDREVPELIGAFLRGPWAQVAAASQLGRADGVSDPDGYLALVDDLIWSVQLRLARRNRAKLVKMVPALLVKLRQGLQLIHYPEERIPVLFDALVSLHEQAFEAPRADGGEPDAEAMAARESEFAESVLNPQATWLGELEASESGYVGGDADDNTQFGADSVLPADAEPSPWSVADLNIGSWVELMLQGVWVRAQLTWASPHQTLFMFVSGKGLAHSMSRRTMDRRRAQGLIRVVSDGNLVGSALDAVAQTALRNNPERTQTPPP